VDVATPGLVTHDLTALGTTDWKHFGRDSATTVNRKAGVPQLISDFVQIGST
jgi:hypothetical protein